MGTPHLESFDYFITHGIQDCLNNLSPQDFELPNGENIVLKIEECFVSFPEVPSEVIGVETRKMYPTECRQRASTYSGMVNILLHWSKDGEKQPPMNFDIGRIPIMLKVTY